MNNINLFELNQFSDNTGSRSKQLQGRHGYWCTYSECGGTTALSPLVLPVAGVVSFLDRCVYLSDFKDYKMWFFADIGRISNISRCICKGTEMSTTRNPTFALSVNQVRWVVGGFVQEVMAVLKRIILAIQEQ